MTPQKTTYDLTEVMITQSDLPMISLKLWSPKWPAYDFTEILTPQSTYDGSTSHFRNKMNEQSSKRLNNFYFHNWILLYIVLWLTL